MSESECCALCREKAETLMYSGACSTCQGLLNAIADKLEPDDVIELARRMGSIEAGQYAEKLIWALCLGLRSRLDKTDDWINYKADGDHTHD